MNLWRSRAYGVNVEKAGLSRSNLEADLRGARFEQANVADASLVGAVVDEAAAASLSRAVNWRKARFDHETLEIVRRQCNGTLPPAAGSQPNAGTPPSP